MSQIIPAWRDNILEPIDKLKVHELGLKHPAISVFVMKGHKILLQQRAATKYHSPNLWTNTVCTHPNWDEPSEICAQRRLQEELNITGLNLVFKGKIEYRADVGNDLIEHEVVTMFSCSISDDLDLFVKPNQEEVSNVDWQTLPQIKFAVQKTPHLFTEWFKIYLEKHSETIFGY